MSDCLFCKIASGDIPSYKIYEDDNYLAFLDVFPLTKGHTLVIPKAHYKWVWDVENGGEYFEKVQEIAKHLQNVSGEEVVYSMIHGEGVPHAHIHLFPKNGESFSDALSTMVPNVKIDDDKKINVLEAQELVTKYKMK